MSEYSRFEAEEETHTSLSRLADALKRGDQPEALRWLEEQVRGGLTGGVGRERRLAPRRARYMVDALHLLATVPSAELHHEHKQDFFARADKHVGHTALMLSGSGMLAAFHFGVVKELYVQGLLPNIVSGASGGAYVAGVIGTRPPQSLAATLNDATLSDVLSRRYDLSDAAGRGLRSKPISPESLEQRIAAEIPDLTFAEAFAQSGIAINVTVTPARIDGHALVMSARTTPDAYVRDAVRASCSVPGVFPPVQLMMKAANGQRAPFLEGQRWSDGAIASDLPADELRAQYGAKHFIASVANPFISWALRDRADQHPIEAAMWRLAITLHRTHCAISEPFARALSNPNKAANKLVRIYYAIAKQTYAADVLIVPTELIIEWSRLLSPINRGEAAALIAHGRASAERKAWLVRSHADVRQALDDLTRRTA